MSEYTECNCGNKKLCVIALCMHCGHTICWHCQLKPVDGYSGSWWSACTEPYYTCAVHPDYHRNKAPDSSLKEYVKYLDNVWYHPDLIKEVSHDEA